MPALKHSRSDAGYVYVRSDSSKYTLERRRCCKALVILFLLILLIIIVASPTARYFLATGTWSSAKAAKSHEFSQFLLKHQELMSKALFNLRPLRPQTMATASSSPTDDEHLRPEDDQLQRHESRPLCFESMHDLRRTIAEDTAIYGSLERSLETCSPRLVSKLRRLVHENCSTFALGAYDFIAHLDTLCPPSLTAPVLRANHSSDLQDSFGSGRIYSLRRVSNIIEHFSFEHESFNFVMRSVKFNSTSQLLQMVVFIESVDHPKVDSAQEQGIGEKLFITSLHLQIEEVLAPGLYGHSVRCASKAYHSLKHYLLVTCALTADPAPLRVRASHVNTHELVFRVQETRLGIEFLMTLEADRETLNAKQQLVQCIRPVPLESFVYLPETVPELVANGLMAGIQHFYIYVRSLDELEPVLVNFVDEGLLTVVLWPSWKSKGFSRSISGGYDQSLMMADCTMRFSHHALILHADFDEFIGFGVSQRNRIEALSECAAVDCLAERASCIGSMNIRQYLRMPSAVLGLSRFIFGKSRVETTHDFLITETFLERTREPQRLGTRILVQPGRVDFVAPHVAWAGTSCSRDSQQQTIIVRHFMMHNLNAPCERRPQTCVSDFGYMALSPLLHQIMNSRELRSLLQQT